MIGLGARTRHRRPPDSAEIRFARPMEARFCRRKGERRSVPSAFTCRLARAGWRPPCRRPRHSGLDTRHATHRRHHPGPAHRVRRDRCDGPDRASRDSRFGPDPPRDEPDGEARTRWQARVDARSQRARRPDHAGTRRQARIDPGPQRARRADHAGTRRQADLSAVATTARRHADRGAAPARALAGEGPAPRTRPADRSPPLAALLAARSQRARQADRAASFAALLAAGTQRTRQADRSAAFTALLAAGSQRARRADRAAELTALLAAWADGTGEARESPDLADREPEAVDAEPGARHPGRPGRTAAAATLPLKRRAPGLSDARPSGR